MGDMRLPPDLPRDLAGMLSRVESLERRAVVKTPWQRVAPVGTPGVAFGTNMTHYDVGTWGPVEWRMVGDEVQLRGSARSISGVVPGASTVVITGLPAAARYHVYPLPNHGGNFLQVSQGSGIIVLGLTAPSNWVACDTVRYSIAPPTAA